MRWSVAVKFLPILHARVIMIRSSVAGLRASIKTHVLRTSPVSTSIVVFQLRP